MKRTTHPTTPCRGTKTPERSDHVNEAIQVVTTTRCLPGHADRTWTESSPPGRPTQRRTDKNTSLAVIFGIMGQIECVHALVSFSCKYRSSFTARASNAAWKNEKLCTQPTHGETVSRLIKRPANNKLATKCNQGSTNEEIFELKGLT